MWVELTVIPAEVRTRNTHSSLAVSSHILYQQTLTFLGCLRHCLPSLVCHGPFAKVLQCVLSLLPLALFSPSSVPPCLDHWHVFCACCVSCAFCDVWKITLTQRKPLPATVGRKEDHVHIFSPNAENHLYKVYFH